MNIDLSKVNKKEVKIFKILKGFFSLKKLN